MVGTVCEFIENKNGRFPLRIIFKHGRQGSVPVSNCFRTAFAPLFGHFYYFSTVRREKFNFNVEVMKVGAIYECIDLATLFNTVR